MSSIVVMRRPAGTLVIVVAVIAAWVSVRAAIVPTVDQYLCYKAALAKGETKLPKGLTTTLTDRIGGTRTFAVKRVTAICNPADRDGSGIAHVLVDLEGVALAPVPGTPRFVKRDRVTVDALTPLVPRTLT